MLNITDANAITLKTLIEMYGEETGKQIFFNEFENIFSYHGLAWKIGKVNLHYFCNIFLYDFLFDYSNDNIPLSETHYELWDEVQNNILNKNNTKNCYVFPRSFGKTNTISIPTILWSALYCLHPFNVIVSSTIPQAQIFLADIKRQVEDNQYITNSFGEVINKNLKNNAEEFELDIKPQRSKIQCFGSTSSMRGIKYNGKRIGLLVLDDAQDDKQIQTEESRAKLVTQLTDSCLNGFESSNNHAIALGTVHYKNDVYDTFLNSIQWNTRQEKAILLDDIDKYFRENEHWLKFKDILTRKETPYFKDEAEEYYFQHKEEMDFPIIWDNYSRVELATKYYDNPVSFKQEYQSDIDHLGEKRIHSLIAFPLDEIEKNNFTKTVLSIDPAAVNKKENDFYSFVIMSEGENHIKYARKAIIEKMEYDQYIDMVIKLLEQYTDINALSIEKNTYMGADVAKIRERIAQHPELRNRALTIYNKQRTANKDARINAIIPDINMGRIIFNEADTAAIDQIKEFSGCAYTLHDDAIDCVADCCEILPQVKLTGEYYFMPFNQFGFY